MKRSKFSLSHYKLLSCDMGELVPIGLTEVLPGDTVQQATSLLVRCQPLFAPVMHPVHVRVHHWFVPFRIIWDAWEDFITGGPDGMDASVFPTRTGPATPGYAVGSLADYLGIPVGVANLVHSVLPLRAYALIWNEFYRDQDLQTELVISKASGNDTTTAAVLQNVAWEKDYFTSARPWEQKGPAVTIPLTGNAPVTGIAIGAPQSYVNNATGFKDSTGASPPSGTDWSGSSPGFRIKGDDATDVPKIFADLSGITAVNMNDLREALALQRFEEARARFGSRYTEYLRYLGVRSSDARLQRPEYLGGGRQTIQFSEVLQTTPASGGN